MTTLLEIKNLRCWLKTQNGFVKAINNLSFSISRGETFSLIGESGCGKSMTALAITRLLPNNAYLGNESEINFMGENLLNYSEVALREIRGKKIAMIFQEPMTSLNPVLTIGMQLDEILKRHTPLNGVERKKKCLLLLDQMGVSGGEKRLKNYPFELSGGMKQRVMIAIALACEPDLLIADEPTTALDVMIQAQIIELLKKIQNKTGMAILFITHNLAVASEISDRIGLMREGRLIESEKRIDFFKSPVDAYTKQLILGVVDFKRKEPEQKREAEEILCVTDVKVYFPIKRGFFQKAQEVVKAVDGVSFRVCKGETVALVGESGCGKTTVAKSILKLIKEPTEGYIYLNGFSLKGLSEKKMRPRRQEMQIIFQDPYSSLNPRMILQDILEEGLLAQKIIVDSSERKKAIQEVLEQVGLSPDHIMRYPHEFSGGQRQRIAIARSLILKPQILVCDEPTSALDVFSQALILELLKKLQKELGLAYLLISHDLSVISHMADKILVMYLGRIVEEGKTEDILNNPQHPYTKSLLHSAPKIF